MTMRERFVILLLGLFFSISLTAGEYQIIDGKVVFPASDITGTASFFTVEDVTFFVGKNSSGDIVSHMNACQACGPAGFTQVGTAMKCKTCGLEYELDILGVDNPGSCWPFYVPNSVVGENVEIKLTDLGLSDTPVLQSLHATQSAISLSVESHKKMSLQVQKSGVYTLNVTTILGRSVMQKKMTLSGEKTAMDFSSLAKGSYIVQVKGPETKVEKLVHLY